MRLRKNILRGCVLSLVFIMTIGCQASPTKNESDNTTDGTPALQKVNLVLDWVPNTNHTGLYVAKEKGYFKELGLDVDIIQPGENSADQMVASGNVQFGVSYQENVTLARTQGVPLVSLAAVIQHNTSGFASPIEKGITSPKLFEGKTYGGWGSPNEEAMIESLMETERADPSKVDIMSIGTADYFTAVKQTIDFAWIYYAWTGVEAELREEPMNIVYLKDFNKELDFYTPILVTNEQLIKERPELVAAFVQGAAKGYTFAINNPDAAADILIKAEPELDPKLVRASQRWLSPRYQDTAARWGEQHIDVWTNYANWMRRHQLLEGNFDPKQAFTNDFLP